MSDTELKLLITLVGVVSAIIGALASILVFFWLEARKRYQAQTTGLRVLVILAESMQAAVKANASETSSSQTAYRADRVIFFIPYWL